MADPFTLEILEVFHDELILIIEKMNHKCDLAQIRRWLNNFNEDDRIGAIEILLKLVHVNEEQLFLGAERLVADIVSSVPNDSIFYFYPIAKYGKSATMFAFYLKKSVTFKSLLRSRKAFFLKNPVDYESTVIFDNTVLVFFDDFFGSGGSFIKSHEKIVSKSSPGIKTAQYQFAASLYRMVAAEASIRALCPLMRFVGNLHYPVFGNSPAMFATSFQVNLKKQLAYSYSNGRNLFTSDAGDHNLGYHDSQAMISFEYMPPNNTLPIIWSSKSAWRPLLPRDTDDIYQKEFENKNRTLTAAAKMEFGVRPGEFRKYDQSRLHVLLILSYIKRKTAMPLILVELGLDPEFLDLLLERAQKMGYLGSKFNLTENGLSQLAELQQVKRQLANVENKKTDVRDFEVQYVAKTVPR